MKPVVLLQKKSPAAASTRLQLVADLFHALNQPITGLRCSLELSLDHPRSAEQYRDTLQTGLQQAEQIAHLASGIRELLQAEDPGDARRILALDAYLKEGIAEWQPLAESSSVLMLLDAASSCPVYMEPRRLRQALFHLLEFVLHSAAVGAVVEFEMSPQREETAIALSIFCDDRKRGETSSTAEGGDQSLNQRLSLALATAIFETAGGSLHLDDSPESFRVELRLPWTGGAA